MLGVAPKSEAQVVRSQCLGIIDYAHELLVQNLSLDDTTPIGGGLVQVTLSGQLLNASAADFTLARVSLNPAQTSLDIQTDVAAANDMSFGPIGPAGLATSSAPLTVVLPDAQVAQLLAELNSGALPVTVHAEEIIKAAPGNKIGYLSGIGVDGDVDTNADGVVVTYTWPSMSRPSVDLDAVRFESVTPAPGDSYGAYVTDPDQWFVVPELFDEYEPASGLPQSLRKGHLRVVYMLDVGRLGHGWYTFALWDDADPASDLASIFQSGSFCTTTEHHVDPVDGASRMHSIAGELLDIEERNSNGQGIRFNEVFFDALEVNGQVQGHAIKPDIAISLRPGGEKRFVARLETDLSFSAYVRAEAEAPAVDEPLSLYDLCFPLPPLPLGPIEIPLSLHLGHDIHLDANLQAGATLGLQKRVASGYTLGWDQRRPAGNQFFADAFSQSTPMQFTPPRLLDDIEAHAGVSTNLQLTLNIGTGADPTGNCVAGFGPYIKASAGGDMIVSPADDPWWLLSHRAAISGGIDMNLLGFSLIDQEAELVEFTGRETLAGSRTRGPQQALAEGEDQRWAMAVEDVANDGPTEMIDTRVAATPDGGAAVVSSDVPRTSAFDFKGRYLWDHTYALGYVPRDVFAAYDGTIYALGIKTPGTWIAAYDPNGNLLWSREHRLVDAASGAHCLIDRGAMNYDANGAPTFLLVGRLQAQRPKACALRLDASGTEVWSKVFEIGLPQALPGADSDGDGIDDAGDNCPWVANSDQIDSNGDGVGNACTNGDHSALAAGALSDGGFAIVGNVRDTIGPSDALVVRIDDDGTVEWAGGYLGRARQFNAVTEAFDGSLYMTGEADSTLTMTEAAFLVARITADGDSGAGTLLFGDDTWELLLASWDNSDASSIVRSFNDGGLSIAAAPDGAVAVGHIGSPLSPLVAGVAVKVNSHLGTEWQMTWDHADDAELLHSIVPTQGGYLVSGRTNSLNSDNLGNLLLMKLPYEGQVAFEPQHGFVDRYLATGSTGERGANYPGFVTKFFHSVDGITTDLGPVATLHTASDGLCVTRLTETGGDSALDDCGDDDDGDGVPNDSDNCLVTSNISQQDTDSDGFGNACDADLNNDCSVNFGDLAALKAAFFPGPFDPDADLNSDGFVNFADLARMKQTFFNGADPGPGPSGLPNACD